MNTKIHRHNSFFHIPKNRRRIRKNMRKRYTIMQKKQKELESQLNRVLSLPPDTPCHQRVSQDIQQQFLFFKTLLSAEIASHPRNPSHLKHIKQWLLEREAAFHEWDSFQSSTLVDHLETGSNCSCTESCLNDDGEEATEGLSELEQAAEDSTELTLAPGLYFEGFNDNDNVEHVPETEPVKNNVESVWVEATKRNVIRQEETNGVLFGKCLAPLGSGVLIGMILMAVFMVSFSDCFYGYESTDYTFSPSPT